MGRYVFITEGKCESDKAENHSDLSNHLQMYEERKKMVNGTYEGLPYNAYILIDTHNKGHLQAKDLHRSNMKHPPTQS